MPVLTTAHRLPRLRRAFWEEGGLQIRGEPWHGFNAVRLFGFSDDECDKKLRGGEDEALQYMAFLPLQASR